jgi:hypothetical protein
MFRWNWGFQEERKKYSQAFKLEVVNLMQERRVLMNEEIHL